METYSNHSRAYRFIVEIVIMATTTIIVTVVTALIVAVLRAVTL